MKIFQLLYKNLPELKDYLDYYFEEKRTNVFGAIANVKRKLCIKMVKSKVLLPTDYDNRRATNELCHSLAEGDKRRRLSLKPGVVAGSNSDGTMASRWPSYTVRAINKCTKHDV